MAKFGKALMSLLLDKKARDALEAKSAATQAYQQQRTTTRERPQRAPPARHPSQDEINARLDEAHKASVTRAGARSGTPGRQQLIQQAMQVRANKAKMLDDLPEEQRLKLKAMAMMSFMKSRPGG